MSESQGQQQTKAGRTIASLFSSPAKKEKVQAQRFVWGQRNSSLKKIKWVLFDGGFLFFFREKELKGEPNTQAGSSQFPFSAETASLLTL